MDMAKTGLGRRALLGLIGPLLSLACGPSEAPRTALPLGAVIDRTGPRATASWSQAIRLAADLANQGLLSSSQYSGMKFEFALADSASDPTLAVSRGKTLVRDSGAKALITDSSEDDIALNMLGYDADAANDLNVPILCMACTSPSINNPTASSSDAVRQAALRNSAKWNFRALMNSTPQATVLLQIATRRTPPSAVPGDSNGDGKFKVAVYYSTDSFGTGFLQALKTTAAGLSLSPEAIVEELPFDPKLNPDTYNWSADLGKLTDAVNTTDPDNPVSDGRPDLIIDVAPPQFSAALMRVYLTGGLSIPFLHTHNFRSTSVLRQLGSELDGQEGTSHVLLDNGESGRVFASQLTAAQNGIAPAFEDSHSFDAATALMLASLIAMQQNGIRDPSLLTGAQIRDALPKTSDPAGQVIRTGEEEFAKAVNLIARGEPINYEGASGPMDFDSNGNVLNRLAHWKVTGGAFSDLERYDCVAAAQCPLQP